MLTPAILVLTLEALVLTRGLTISVRMYSFCVVGSGNSSDLGVLLPSRTYPTTGGLGMGSGAGSCVGFLVLTPGVLVLTPGCLVLTPGLVLPTPVTTGTYSPLLSFGLGSWIVREQSAGRQMFDEMILPRAQEITLIKLAGLCELSARG